jgi:hypothetical protein
VSSEASPADTVSSEAQAPTAFVPSAVEQPPGEIGGPEGPEPTRYGDWEIGGRCTDF